jgi:hypothetical protein
MHEEGFPKARPIDVSPSPFCQRSHSSALWAAVNPTRLYFFFIAITSPVQGKVLNRPLETAAESGRSNNL